MSHSSPALEWRGPAVGTAVEWFIQAVDGAGNVAVTSNKAFIKSVVTPAPTGDIQAEATGPQTNGWYTGTVSVTISGAPGISYSLDGAPFTPAAPPRWHRSRQRYRRPLAGLPGQRRLSRLARRPDRRVEPTVTVNATYGFGQVAHAVCADSGSGIASCTVPDPLDTSSVGTKTIHVHAEDRAGHVFEPPDLQS